MITIAEWRVMATVWANPMIDALTIYDVLGEELQWSVSTVKTLLARLVKKGYLQTDKRGKTYHYVATVSKQDMVAQKVEENMNLLCRTKQAEIFYHLTDKVAMTKQDIQRLMDKLQQLAQEAPDKVECQCAKGQCSCCPVHNHK